MAWIETISEDAWDRDHRVAVIGEVAGRADAIMAVHSLNPRGMLAHQAVYSSAMRGTASLRKVDRELVALVVSQINDCHY